MSARRLAARALPALLALSAAPLGAQSHQLRGVLVDSAVGRPAALVTVVLVDGGGRAVAQTLSSPEGRFALAAPAPGRYQVRALRVGYQPVESAPVELGAGGAAPPTELTLQMRSVPVNLAAVKVSAKAKCLVRPADGSAAFAVWEEARKALQATLLGQHAALLRVRVTDVVRDLDPKTLRPRREAERAERGGIGVNPYESLPPEDIARNGFVRSDGTTITYYAPDARVLLSEEFLRDHCLRPARDAARPGLIGLAFEPLSGITRPDIGGVLWLDERSAELRFLEFHYTALAEELRHPSLGGRVDFQRLPAGHWIIQRWVVRAPMAGRPPQQMGVQTVSPGAVTGSSAYGVSAVPTVVLLAIREAAGEVEEAALLDGTRLWGAREGVVTGVVTDSLGAPVAGALVRLQDVAGPPAATDAQGRYRLDHAPAGRRIVLWSPPAAAALSATVRGPTLEVARDSTVEAPPAAMPRVSVLRGDLCAGSGRSLGPTRPGVLVGVVRDSAARAPAPAAAVDLAWDAADSSSGGDPRPVTEQLRVRTDSAGWFRACGLPAGLPVRLRAAVGDRTADGGAVKLDATGITRRDVAVP